MDNLPQRHWRSRKWHQIRRVHLYKYGVIFDTGRHANHKRYSNEEIYSFHNPINFNNQHFVSDSRFRPHHPEVLGEVFVYP